MPLLPQVCEAGATLVDCATLEAVARWTPAAAAGAGDGDGDGSAGGRSITVAAANMVQCVLALGGGTLVCLEVRMIE